MDGNSFPEFFYNRVRILLYRNFHFIYAGYRVAWIIPLLGGVRGGFLGREISVNISRITALPTPKSPPKRGLSNLTESGHCHYNLQGYQYVRDPINCAQLIEPAEYQDHQAQN